MSVVSNEVVRTHAWPTQAEATVNVGYLTNRDF